MKAMSGPRGARRAGLPTRRGDLLDAADRVIFREGPDASMTQIASEAGITKPILYRHFGDKGGLYRALAMRYVSPLLAELRRVLSEPSDGRERMVAAIDTYLRFIATDPQRYRFLMHRALLEQPEARSLVAEFVHQVGDEVAAALRRDLAPPGSASRSTDAWGQAIVGMVQVAGDWWLEQPDVPLEVMVSHLSTLLWDGVAALEVHDAREDAREPDEA